EPECDADEPARAGGGSRGWLAREVDLNGAVAKQRVLDHGIRRCIRRVGCGDDLNRASALEDHLRDRGILRGEPIDTLCRGRHGNEYRDRHACEQSDERRLRIHGSTSKGRRLWPATSPRVAATA